MARTKNAIGTTTRFANNEIGVTRWKYHRINGSDPIHAARETLPARNSQSKLACIKHRGPRTSTRGKKGSATLQRSNDRRRGSANNTMTQATAKDRWTPGETRTLVTQQ